MAHRYLYLDCANVLHYFISGEKAAFESIRGVLRLGARLGKIRVDSTMSRFAHNRRWFAAPAGLLTAYFMISACCPAWTAAARSESKLAPLRHVGVTILGSLRGGVGVPAPRVLNPLSPVCVSIEEPCDLTVHLPSGKTITLRTRPILILSSIAESDTLLSVFAPPQGPAGTLAEKVDQIEALVKDWGITPDKRMRDDLSEWKRESSAPSVEFKAPPETQPASAPASRATANTQEQRLLGQMLEASAVRPTMRRCGTDVDDRVAVSFRVDGASYTELFLVVEIEGQIAEWDRAHKEHDSRTGPTTNPSTAGVHSSP